MAHTMTGPFPIGFRRGGSAWQKDLAGVLRFAKENAFECLDVGAEPPEVLTRIAAAGLKVGTADLGQPWDGLASADAGKRKSTAENLAEQVKAAVAAGVKTFFVVVFPEDHAKRRRENLALAADGYGRLCAAIAPLGARIAIEGYPGGPPHHAALACTPEGYRAFFGAVGSDVVGVNFDPSHLIRMGIDPVRFLGEFAPRVYHVHGKDTELFDEGLYEFGNLQLATLAEPHAYGAFHWRYTIPGHGLARWGMLLRILRSAGYQGCVSIELEDENFNGSEEGEKRGLIASRDYLAHV